MNEREKQKYFDILERIVKLLEGIKGEIYLARIIKFEDGKLNVEVEKNE